MPDTNVAHGQQVFALAKSSLKGAIAEAGLAGSPISLVMVGLMGEPPWFNREAGPRNWAARSRALLFAPFGGDPAIRQDETSPGSLLSLGILNRWTGEPASLARFASAAVLVALATMVCLPLRPHLQIGSLVLPYLIAIVLTAVGLGLLPSLFAGVLSVLTFDYLFIPPFYSLTISDPDDVTRLVIFALTALIVSNLAAYARRQAVMASLRAEVAEDLYQFGRQLAGAATLREVLDTSLPRLRDILRARVRIVLPDEAVPAENRETRSGTPAPADAIPGTEFALIKSWLREDNVAGAETFLPVSELWALIPMTTARGKVGVLAIARADLDHVAVPNTGALFGTVADLLAQAIDRINLVDDLNQASRAAEREALHAALLASLSHDLRTPLASVLSSTESLIAQGEALAAESRRDLALSIQDDARRLNRYIGNLLDMTRLETGLADAMHSQIDLADVVSVALERCAIVLSAHRIAVEIESGLPFLAGDEVLLEHVLFNLLDNAAKYAPPGTLIQLRAFRATDHVAIEIIDEGIGIRPEDLGRIFDKFYRGGDAFRRAPGIGLGLAICRGYVEAMDGHISARNREDRGGAIFTITLPIPAGEARPERIT